jgi:hypothetical protein
MRDARDVRERRDRRENPVQSLNFPSSHFSRFSRQSLASRYFFAAGALFFFGLSCLAGWLPSCC